MIRKVFCFSIFFIVTACDDTEATVKDSSIVKLSSSGICHDASSSSYERTKSFTPFSSLKNCLKAGGRLPKSQSSQYDKAETEAIEENRNFVSLYDRNDWPHWIDEDKDCQNTRHELLIATSKTRVTFKTDKGCLVISGSWYDPYSGRVIVDASALDLDHIVPLRFAHGHGGNVWTREKRQAFANDYDNLVFVDASLNRQKGAKGPDEWLPPNHRYRCTYIDSFMTVIEKYKLHLVPSETRIINKMQSACSKP
ncbi:HNH endonuclease [Alteromonas sp. NFXS44]|uniref:GmrSD restriction endonuclease domain-containing protein n=1 Tax=Alteromonas sp. NFXS44 TaxID=2818435 RepID=UPI0032E0128C